MQAKVVAELSLQLDPTCARLRKYNVEEAWRQETYEGREERSLADCGFAKNSCLVLETKGSCSLLHHLCVFVCLCVCAGLPRASLSLATRIIRINPTHLISPGPEEVFPPYRPHEVPLRICMLHEASEEELHALVETALYPPPRGASLPLPPNTCTALTLSTHLPWLS